MYLKIEISLFLWVEWTEQDKFCRVAIISCGNFKLKQFNHLHCARKYPNIHPSLFLSDGKQIDGNVLEINMCKTMEGISDVFV